MTNNNDTQNLSGEFQRLTQHFNIDANIIKLLMNRGYDSVEKIENFLSPSKNDFRDTLLLNNAAACCERIKKCAQNKERVLVFGDYDVDGVCATSIMLKLFEKLGHKSSYYLPNRFVDGYGLTIEVIDKIIDRYHPSLIITVDCGISCAEEVEYIKSKGIEIIVTDHHEIPEKLPNCLVVNAKLPNQKYEFNGLCGAGLAYKIASQILGYENSLDLLAIACIATIADIVPLKDENRAIVSLGLKEMENNLPIGVKYLFRNQKIVFNNLTASDIAFKIAPKLNASGRMGEANDSLLLFTQTNPNFLKSQIAKILEHNTKRQEICNSVYDDCVSMLKTHNLANEMVIILSSEKWDSGILGIIASRLVDLYQRPVFLFANNQGVLRGSGRSVDDVNIHDILLRSKDILQTFGGHTMAAGLTVSVDNFDEFSRRCEDYMKEIVDPELLHKKHRFDIDISPKDITDKLISDMRKLEPFGCENEMPIFRSSPLSIIPTALKNFPCHINLDIDKALSLIYFNGESDRVKIKYCDKTIVYYRLQPNNAKRKNVLSGILEDIEFSNSLKSYCLAEGEAYYLKQLTNISSRNLKNCTYYKQQNISDILTDTDSFGTLIVASTYESYQKFIRENKSIIIRSSELFSLGSTGGQNTIIYAPTSFDGFNNFKKIIFLDAVLDAGYIANLNACTDASIFVPQSTSFSKKQFSLISTKREEFGKVFTAIKQFGVESFSTVYELFNRIKKSYKQPLSFAMFYFAYLVFIELGIINKQKSDSKFVLTITDKQSSLNNSQIYNIANFIKKTMK